MLQVIPDEELSKEQLIKLLNSQRRMLHRYVSELQLYHALSDWLRNGKNYYELPWDKIEPLLYDYERSQNFSELPKMTVKFEESTVSSAG